MKLFDLTGRTALITGAGRGIGFAIAEALAGAGATVVINGRTRATLEQAADELRAKHKARVETAAFDVTEAAAVNEAVASIEAAIGPIDILVNNAGMQRRAPLEQFSDEDWHELMRTNVDSVYFVSKAVARKMIERRAGKIINIGSVQCELARPSIAPYTASKGGVKMLTKAMAIDLAPHGLNVNGIGPGYFRTELNRALVEDEKFSQWLVGRTPGRRWGELEDLGGAAVFLAGDASRFVNGHILYVDGGITASL